MVDSPLATQPCPKCGARVVPILAAGAERVWLDPRSTIYVRERDGEGGYVWARWEQPQDVLARHECGQKLPKTS